MSSVVVYSCMQWQFSLWSSIIFYRTYNFRNLPQIITVMVVLQEGDEDKEEEEEGEEEGDNDG